MHPAKLEIYKQIKEHCKNKSLDELKALIIDIKRGSLSDTKEFKDPDMKRTAFNVITAVLVVCHNIPEDMAQKLIWEL